MKIAFLSFYSGEVYRGVETHVHMLANELVKLGHEVTVYQNGKQLKESRYHTVSIGLPINWKAKAVRVPFINYRSLLIKQFSQRAISEISKDTEIIIPTNGDWQYVYAKLWALRNHRKMVIAGHSGIGLDERIALYCFPDRFVCFTNYQLRRSKQRNPFLKFRIIPNGVDIGQFQNAKPMKLDLLGPVIMTSSALVPLKRIDLIINAVSKLDASLLIVGSGSEEGKLKTLCDMKLKGRYKIISLQYNEMPSAYKSADIFTFATSPWESFGIVLIEAMASGLGVVSTDDPIRQEIVGEAGIFVNPKNTDAYMRALKKALSVDWGDKPRQQAEKFSWDKLAKQYSDLFEEITK